MRRFLCVLIVILSCCRFGAPVRAETVTLDDTFPPDASSVCGVPGPFSRGGLTAIQSLPPVRIVVFDPISNSFAFLACKPDGKADRATISPQDFLDRRRLALTTQKIRLLILPYNPADGDLILEVVNGKGVEFENIVGGLPPPTATAEEKKEEELAEEEKPEMLELANPDVQARVDAALRPLGDPSDQALRERAARSTNTPYERLALMKAWWGKYSELADEVIEQLRSLRVMKRCIGANLKTAPALFTQDLAKTTLPHLSLERDVTLEELTKEVERRNLLITNDFYTTCQAPMDQGFQGDIMAFETLAQKAALGIERLNGLSREMATSMRRLPLAKPSEISNETWTLYLESMRDFMDQMEDFDASLQATLDELLGSAEQLHAEHDKFQNARSSPAMQIQRFNFEPLGDGQSITFQIRRGPKQPGDDLTVPARANKLELKSAPVHVMRFGMGLVASQLKTDGAGQVLPGLFLHHYWGRRSPLLEPTAFERWMPTFSVGIPVSEAEALSQFFLGLDWELVPGFEINVGHHFGKINVGNDGTPPVPVEKLKSDLYFGIVVTRDAFDSVFGGGKK